MTSPTVHDPDPAVVAAVEALHTAGAHLVLARANKRPIDPAWQKIPPHLDRTLQHIADGGLVGVIPGSLDAVVLDLDAGDPAALVAILGPAVITTPSRRDGGMHLWYRRPARSNRKRIRNGNWVAGNARGDVRGDAGYVVLWDAVGVAAGLGDLQAAHPVDLAALQAPAKVATPAPTAPAHVTIGDVDELATRMIARHLAAVAAAPEGTRNNTLHAAATAIAGLAKAGRVDWANVRGELLAASALPEAEALWAIDSGHRAADALPEPERPRSAPQTVATVRNSERRDAGKEDVTAAVTSSPDVRADAQDKWRRVGRICADKARTHYRYDPASRAWHRWDGQRWHEEPDTCALADRLSRYRFKFATKAEEDGDRAVADCFGNRRDWEAAIAKPHSELNVALRTLLARAAPSPPAWEIATPAGVVDTRTGTIVQHDAARHDTLAVTHGRYRPADEAALDAALWARLQHNLSRGDYDALIAQLGVAAARRARDFRSIAWLYGVPGSGKSSCSSLLVEAWGDLAAGVTHDFFERRGGDIDADLASILEADPVLIACNEITGARAARLNSVTGGDVMGARRPHGKIIRRALSGMLLASSVKAPKLPINEGLARRVIVFGFPRVYPSDGRDHAITQDERDAAVTLPLLAAAHVGREGWTPPAGNTSARTAFLDRADPITAWLDGLPDSYAGTEIATALADYNAEEGDDVSLKLIGSRVHEHPRWESVRGRRGQPRRLRGRALPMHEDQGNNLSTAPDAPD